jgi:Ulp1 family protease
VRKWTARFELFKKDFIVVPVNQSLHWTLAIVCHPGEAVRRAAARGAAGADDEVIEARANAAVPAIAGVTLRALALHRLTTAPPPTPAAPRPSSCSSTPCAVRPGSSMKQQQHARM